jgi:hypothetical protein
VLYRLWCSLLHARLALCRARATAPGFVILFVRRFGAIAVVLHNTPPISPRQHKHRTFHIPNAPVLV